MALSIDITLNAVAKASACAAVFLDITVTDKESLTIDFFVTGFKVCVILLPVLSYM